tara:strand:+ start:830 stop:1486 length:657 start_codon:yes stop_codon:yes gene_type:complete
MTYNDLVDQIRSYTEVDANVLTTTVVNGIIKNAEFRVLRDVDSDNNRRYATSQFVTNQRYLDLPNDILIIRSVQVSDSSNFNTGTTRTFMEKRDTSFISEYNGSGIKGQPKYYANWDENTMVVAPTPNDTYGVQVNYILKDGSIIDNNTGTYLSEEFPNGLLYACLVEAYGFLKGPNDVLQLYEQRYKQAVDGFLVEQVGRRRKDEYQDGVPRLNMKQ